MAARRKGHSWSSVSRLKQGKRIFWRDIHAVTGIYFSFFALFLLLTGLPWAKRWGTHLKAARHLYAGVAVHQDWTTSSSEAVAARIARTDPAPDTSGLSTMHEMPDMPGMRHMEGMEGMSATPAGNPNQGKRWGRHASALSGPDAFVAIDEMG